MCPAARITNQTHPARVEEGQAHELQPSTRQSTVSSASEINPSVAPVILQQENQRRQALTGGATRKLLFAAALSLVSFGTGLGGSELARDAASKLRHNPDEYPGQIPDAPPNVCLNEANEKSDCTGLKNKDIAKLEIGISAALFGAAATSGYVAYTTLSGV